MARARSKRPPVVAAPQHGDDFLTVHLLGYRDFMGKYATFEPALAEAQDSGAHEISDELLFIWSLNAPKSQPPVDGNQAPTKKPFAESFHTTVDHDKDGQARIMVETEQPELAGWLREGTQPHEIWAGAYEAPNWQSGEANALHFMSAGGGEVFTAVVYNHPGVWGTNPNPHWENKAAEESLPLILELGNKISRRVVTHFSNDGVPTE